MDDRATGRTTIFALNRSTTETMRLDAELRGLGKDRRVAEALELHHADLKAINTLDGPDNVSPGTNDAVTVDGERVTAELKPLSRNVIVTEAAA